jgi:hypothetical protein
LWQGDTEHSRVFSGPYEPSNEQVLGHVADMIAEGLAALHGASTPAAAFFILHEPRTPSLDTASLFSLD